MIDQRLEELKQKPLVQWSAEDLVWLLTFASSLVEDLYVTRNILSSVRSRLQKFETVG